MIEKVVVIAVGMGMVYVIARWLDRIWGGDDRVSQRWLEQQACADGVDVPESAGPRGSGRKDVDACERADRSKYTSTVE